MHGEKVEWSTGDHLLAAAVDALRAANWQRGGGKGQRPKPIPRPGVEDKSSRRFGTGKIAVSDAKAFFDRVNRAVPEVDGTACKEDGCTGKVHARGWCPKHYQRWRRSAA